MTSFLGTPATAPGPLGPQMLPHTMAIRSDPLKFLALMRDTYGDLVQFPLPWPPSYLVASMPFTQQVLVQRPGTYDKGTIQYRSLSLVTGDGLLVAENDRWREQRPVVQPAFHHGFLPAVAQVVREESGSLIARWRLSPAGAVVDIEAAMMDLTLRVVGRCLFGDDLRGSTAQLADATLSALSVVIKRSRVPVGVPRSWPTPANLHLRRSLAELDSAVERLVAGRSDRPGGSTMLIDLLLDAPGWTATQVRDQVVTFLVAGHETAASALTWALWLLATHPQEQERLAGSGSHLSARAGAVGDETLRLYPPAWVISRNAVAPDEIGGRRIPTGALLIASPYLIHRDPRYWTDPDQFRPTRFEDRLTRTQRLAYLPFGAGPRLCIGRDFARWEMTEVLAALAPEFRWEPVDSSPALLPSVTLRPAGGMRLRLWPR